MDLAVHLQRPIALLACRRGGVDAEDHPATAEIRRQRRALDLAAAVELERDETGERERPAFDHCVAGHHGIGAVAARRRVRSVEGTLERGLERQAIAGCRDRRLDAPAPPVATAVMQSPSASANAKRLLALSFLDETCPALSVSLHSTQRRLEPAVAPAARKFVAPPRDSDRSRFRVRPIG
jgi:hypothetical protein